MVIDELKRRNVQECEVFAPYYIISFACHAFNLANKGREHPIYTHGGLVPILKMPVMYMGLPGCGKSYLMKQLTDEKYGILNIKSYPVTHEQNMTEAGLVGTRRIGPNGEIMEIDGVARENSKGFVVIDEFSAILASMKNSYNSTMESSMLTALDSGKIRKRLASGAIAYDTDFTLWCGIQPAKCDLSGGLGRRICMLLNIMTEDKKRMYKRANRTSDNIRIDLERLATMRDTITTWAIGIGTIEHISLSEELLDFIDIELNTEVAIMEFYKRIAIGYHLSKFGSGKRVVVGLTQELKDIIQIAHIWREQVTQGPDIQNIIELIVQYGDEDDTGDFKVITKIKLNRYGSRAQLSASQIHDLIKDMTKFGYLKVTQEKVYLFKSAIEINEEAVAMNEIVMGDEFDECDEEVEEW